MQGLCSFLVYRLVHKSCNYGTTAFDRLFAIADAISLTGLVTFVTCLQDKPYALFGTCLGAIIAYEIARRASDAGNPPVTLFTAAVSPPHIYAEAVMKLYVTRQLAEGEGIDIAEVMATLQSWDKIPKETLMMVSPPS